MRIANRRAFRNYAITDKLEAGLVLTGAEIKSIRAGRASLEGAFVKLKDGQVYLVNAYIHPWMGARIEDRRERKLLMHRRQIQSLTGVTSAKSFQLVPLAIYIKHNLAKIEIGVGRSKKVFEKRQVIKKRMIAREIEREIRGKN